MLWSLALPFLAAASLADAQGAEPPTQPLLISSISIVSPQDATVGPPRDILIADGKIVKIAEAGSIDRAMASSIIEGLHLYALPGLIDVHAHIGDGGAGQQTIDDRERALHQFLRYGVTTIFVPGGSGGNDDDLAQWRWPSTRG